MGVIAWIAGQILLVRRLVRAQEIAADVNAVTSLGARPAALESALQKLAVMNDQLPGRKDPTSYLNLAAAHPSVDERIAIVRRAVGRGELPADTDVPLLVASLIGPLFYRRWFSREPLSDAFAMQVVQQLVH